MASPYPFAGAAFSSYGDMAFHSQPYGSVDDNLDLAMAYADPSPYGKPWDPPVQRFLRDDQRAFFVADIPGTTASHTPVRSTAGSVVPPPSQSRFASPISSIEQASSGSSHSPPADAESYYDNFPGTPRDTSMLSPFQAPMLLEPYSNHMAQFTGTGMNYVSPLDVNPDQSDYCESDTGIVEFNFAHEYSFDSYTTASAQRGLNTATPALGGRRAASPEEMRPECTSSKPADPPANPRSPTPTTATGAIFNRKDLFTQHLKRMHAPRDLKASPGTATKRPSPTQPSSSSSSSSSAASALAKTSWDARLRHLQDTAVRARCALPTAMRCPVPSCAAAEFRGDDAWNQRMEHVAKHLERHAAGGNSTDHDAPGAGGLLPGGGAADHSLVGWAGRRDVAVIVRDGRGGWALNTLLRRTPGGNMVVLAPVRNQGGGGAAEAEIVVGSGGPQGDGLVDAEGEEDD
ncbi:hypothetical protein BT67DRAFT_464367 [Trichocladium antarcticum]|uniref:Uncharacterized protein n=1 Tax=Trichocladium antarcticum TaxID=1450529 RepID=A0AAN6UES1_9PEZI|nr:hypothetical protein BT67DRAFT_464367 [Trichocladium antarcticum]